MKDDYEGLPAGIVAQLKALENRPNPAALLCRMLNVRNPATGPLQSGTLSLQDADVQVTRYSFMLHPDDAGNAQELSETLTSRLTENEAPFRCEVEDRTLHIYPKPPVDGEKFLLYHDLCPVLEQIAPPLNLGDTLLKIIGEPVRNQYLSASNEQIKGEISLDKAFLDETPSEEQHQEWMTKFRDFFDKNNIPLVAYRAEGEKGIRFSITSALALTEADLALRIQKSLSHQTGELKATPTQNLTPLSGLDESESIPTPAAFQASAEQMQNYLCAALKGLIGSTISEPTYYAPAHAGTAGQFCISANASDAKAIRQEIFERLGLARLEYQPESVEIAAYPSADKANGVDDRYSLLILPEEMVAKACIAHLEATSSAAPAHTTQLRRR